MVNGLCRILEILYQFVNFFFPKYLALLIADGINSGADVQNRRPVGGDDAGSRVGICHDVSKNPAFGGHIQGGGCLVQKQDRGFAEEGSGDGKSLGLAF